MVGAFIEYAFLNNIVYHLYESGFSHISTTIGTTFMECCCYCDSEEEAYQAYDIMMKFAGNRGEFVTSNRMFGDGVWFYVNYKCRVENRFEVDC